MDQSRIKKIFDELIEKYEEAQKSIIYEWGSGVPGKTIEDELYELQQEIDNLRKRFSKELER